ncbi:MAG: hypothetical protein ACQEWV_31900 [Bacillota bacterium]
MKKILSKWWVWVLIVLFILINLLVTNMNNPEEDNETKKKVQF